MTKRGAFAFVALAWMAAPASGQDSGDTRIPITDPKARAALEAFVPPGTRMMMVPGALSATRAVVPGDPAFAREQFGTQDFSATTYTGESFEPAGDTVVRKFPGYLEFLAPPAGGADAVVAMELDSGSLVDGVMWWAYDAEATDEVFLLVFSQCWPFGPGPHVFTLLAFGNTTGNSGHQHLFTGIGPPVTIENNLCNYYIGVHINNAPTPNLTFARARVGWFRQVSPAPATATFGDVPTTHGFFQFVEALARSGITAGCGGGNFCPDQFLTRGQMAVFLSVALGLHFPF
ncbi:MAG TPA: S-layer homology domain-containing protein [Thermoanaerobaculia bacterium]|jgi:hypothetical protein